MIKRHQSCVNHENEVILGNERRKIRDFYLVNYKNLGIKQARLVDGSLRSSTNKILKIKNPL